MIDTNKFLSRLGPSKRYTELLTEYQNMHKVSDGMFNGRSLVKFIDIIKSLTSEKKELKERVEVLEKIITDLFPPTTEDEIPF